MNKLLAQTHYGVGATSRDVRFLVTGDPQYFISNGKREHKDAPDAVLRAMVGQMSASSCNYAKYLAGCQIRGMIVAGDLTQQAKGIEMDWYRDAITGAARFAYDGLGNHDYNGGTVKDYILRDRRRSTVASRVSDKGPHYSWDWHDVHFVQLNLFPGNNSVGAGGEQHDPYHSLDFLRDDLGEHAANGRPVILIHHYGFDDFSRQRVSGDIPRWWGDHHRWDYWDAIARYNVESFLGMPIGPVGRSGRRGTVPAKGSVYEKQLVREIKGTPEEYLPNLLQIVRLFRESVALKPAKKSFRQGWQEALAGKTRAVADLWEGIDVR